MSIAALAMNGFLATLLLAALAMGVRLNARLKGVKDGHAAFVLAVGELNAAAAKAQGALADLRAATDEATDVLGGRIARAREASDRLEKLVNRAETAPMPQPARHSEAPREAFLRQPVREAYQREPAQRDVAAIERELRDATQGNGGLAALLARMEGAVEPSPRLARSAERAARPAFRQTSVDDDLFEDFGGRA